MPGSRGAHRSTVDTVDGVDIMDGNAVSVPVRVSPPSTMSTLSTVSIGVGVKLDRNPVSEYNERQ